MKQGKTILQKLLFTLLTLPLTFFFVSGSLVEAKTDTKKSATATSAQKKWAVIDGFRSAKFGMDEKKVTRAIGKDFKISRSKITRSIHATDKTVNLTISVPKILAVGGVSEVGYIFGYKSKKLTQVNVLWGTGPAEGIDGQEIVDAANLLREHFIKKKYKEDGLATNLKLDDTKILVFRGRDKKNRMALLVLNTPNAKKGESQVDAAKRVTLTASYILDATKPDVRKVIIKEGDF
jgi:hypothetical protein